MRCRGANVFFSTCDARTAASSSSSSAKSGTCLSSWESQDMGHLATADCYKRLLQEVVREFHHANGWLQSPTRKPRFCAAPVERNFVRFHGPLRELRFTQVRRECLHDAAVRNCADKVHQGFLVSPHRECPKFPRKRAGVQRIADETWRASQLAHDF